jgi:hypothetical protein
MQLLKYSVHYCFAMSIKIGMYREIAVKYHKISSAEFGAVTDE